MMRRSTLPAGMSLLPLMAIGAGAFEESASAQGPICFREYSRRNIAMSPQAIVVRDFNNNGSLDAAVVSLLEGGVSLSLNDGSGVFRSGGFYPCGSDPWNLAAADFNGDGFLDLAVINGGFWTSATFTILLNDREGGFTQIGEIPSGGDTAYSVAAGDLNGDGKIDLVAAHDDGIVGLHFGRGDGTFETPQLFLGPERPYAVAIANLDNQSHADLLITSRTHASVVSYFNNGDGSFTQQQEIIIGGWPRKILTGDLNQDGDVDIVVLAVPSDTIIVLINDGAGFLEHRFTYSIGSYDGDLGDLNGDGIIDYAGVDSWLVRLETLTGTGDGKFRPELPYRPFGNPTCVALGDLDSDGDVDAAVIIDTPYYYGRLLTLVGSGCRPLIAVSSRCPDGGSGNVSWSGAAPSGSLAVLLGMREGSFRIPGGFACSGTYLGLDRAGLRLVTVGNSDARGSGSFTANIPPSACGLPIQVLNLEHCLPSEVLIID